MKLSFKNITKEFFETALDAIFPRNCCACYQAADPSRSWRYLCVNCSYELKRIEFPYCSQCGRALDGAIEGHIVCGQCEETKPSFDKTRSVLHYKGAGRCLVHALKYRKGQYVLKDIDKIIKNSSEILRFIEGGILIPVPLHWWRQWWRGYNQSYLIAKGLEKYGKGVKIEKILLRQIYTSSQTRLSRQERLINVKNAFAIRKNSSLNSQLRYILVDDVYTTGATLQACAKVLKKHGAKQVDVVTFCHG